MRAALGKFTTICRRNATVQRAQAFICIFLLPNLRCVVSAHDRSLPKKHRTSEQGYGAFKASPGAANHDANKCVYCYLWLFSNVGLILYIFQRFNFLVLAPDQAGPRHSSQNYASPKAEMETVKQDEDHKSSVRSTSTAQLHLLIYGYQVSNGWTDEGQQDSNF